MAPGPFQVFFDFSPVFHILEFQFFHRCPGYDETVIIPVLDIAEFQVSRFQIGIVGMGPHPAHRPAEIDFQLQGRIAQKPQQLQFRRLFQRHQVQDQDFQRTDILGQGPVVVDGDDIFFTQFFLGRKMAVDFDWHSAHSFIFSNKKSSRPLQGRKHRGTTRLRLANQASRARENSDAPVL